ncbi:MAG: hypothetical protein Q8835_03595, partial [Sweet potato little leaf phytoplasma]|nr:hypothetical protein [Sweet potato little leaf phytoplasma]
DSIPPPKQIPITKGSIVMKVNPENAKWKRHDSLISSWLLGSMSDNILEQVIHCKSAKEIWKCLLQIFNSRNRAQIMRMKTKLQTLQKGSMSLNEYFSQIKKCIDALSAVGKEVDTEDHIMYILTGLGPEYESMVSALTTSTEDQECSR